MIRIKWSEFYLLIIEPLNENILNQQFQSAFSIKSIFTSNQFAESIGMKNRSTQQLSSITISTPGIDKILRNLNPHKAPGPDDISPRVLRETHRETAPLLQLIFDKSLSTGVVPDDWRTANVSPVYKKGQKYSASNYRPISLTSVCCKVMEHIVTSAIMNHGENNGLLYDLQHGFRRGRSCETQLIEFIDDLANNLDKGQQTDVLIMDFAKAFDKVNHSLLTHKLHNYGISGSVNRWIRNWLEGRTQTVVLEGQRSRSVSVDSGVPQGSVLGPSLFLYYINDLQENLNSTVRLFADDTIAYLTVTPKDKGKLLQEDLDKLAKWEELWCMKFHPDKCNVVQVTNRRTPIPTSYNLHGHTLEAVTSAKYLGVTIQNNLKWDSHINNIADKANRTLGFLRRNLRVSSRKIKSQAYFGLVRPQLEYAATVWDPHTQCNINRLEQIQRRAARYVTSRHRNTSSVSDMLNTLQWKSLEQRRKEARLCMFYKIDRGLVAIRKEGRLIPPRRRGRNQHQCSYQLPQSRIDAHKSSYFPRTIRDWNELPDDAVQAKSLGAFKALVSRE